jgi:hypothetical protein
MDDKMVKFWNDGISEMVSTGKTWDFHQKWAEKYGSMLYCPSSGRNCDQDSAKLCKDLAGASVEEKQVGLLGLQAIRNAQEIFVRMHEAIGRASDDLLGSLADFSAVC